LAAAEVHAQLSVVDIDAAPDDLAGLTDALDGRTAQSEVHRRLAFAGRAGPAVGELARRDAAADLEDPDVFVRRPRRVAVAPAQVVQRVLDRLAERLVHPKRHQAVQARALVDLVEVRQRIAGVQLARAVGAAHRRAD